MFFTGQEFYEINRFRWGVLTDGKTVATAKCILWLASATIYHGEGEPTDVGHIVFQVFFCHSRVGAKGPLAHEFHGGLFLGDDDLLIAIALFQIAFLERL